MHNVENMFYVREVPWHGLGIKVEEAPKAKEKIYVDGDMRLTEFILNKFTHWFDEEWKDVSFNDYIADQLLDEFGFKED